MRLDTKGYQSIDLTAETDDELEFLKALTDVIAGGGEAIALPDDGEGVRLRLDGDPNGGVDLN